MSIELKKVAVGLDDETYLAVKASAQVHGRDLGEEARFALRAYYLGQMHGLKDMAARFARAEILGKAG